MMPSKIRKHLTAANAVVTIAVVFAMTGGAYAAKHYLIASIKQQFSPKAQQELKALAGKEGKTGPQGLQGSPGPQGTPGAPGTNGKAGANGENVTAVEVKTGESGCNKLGGAKFTVGGSETFACNGKDGKEGKEGKEGSPWTVGGVLPQGKTEKGTWAATIVKNFEEETSGTASISFGIPPLKTPTVVYITETEKSHPPECPGTPINPLAAEGFLCAYTTAQGFAKFEEAIATSTGAFLNFTGGELAGKQLIGATVEGTWAVTAGA